VPRNLKLKNLQYDSLDPKILERIETLEQLKREALEEEDFDQCKQLKQVIDKLKIVGN
jgi:CMP-2-keto-3-deoxyoctulosonic acid synthetase